MRTLTVHHLAAKLLRYREGLALQETLAAARRAGELGDQLLLLQHHPVYTLGKRGSAADFIESIEALKAAGVDVETAPRGGEVTFHGPGQLVAYPIVNIRQLGVGARAWVEGLERSVVSTAALHGVRARGQVPGRTGVWVGERKLAALGVKISHGISTHGLALNVSTDLSFFKNIVPCGLPDKEVTSLERETGRPLQLEGLVAEQLAQSFAREFGYSEVTVAASDQP
mmetsp:Transcript_31401/g.80470  ORF Transcript_31401/g.80470 Transcript_31401/m.80470 type:complete len:227 (-) Transcript_31401:42-722(-)|eukprot:jgi/Tetstr1/453831/TSEL_003995.t1